MHAQSHVKRVLIPAGLRFKADSQAKNVDLNDFANSLGLQYLPVNEIREA